MYSPEELKVLAIFILAAILGRILFYRGVLFDGTFKQKIKIKCLQWLWELPVVITIALIAFEATEYFKFQSHTGNIVAIAVGYIGVNTFKIWVEEWLEAKLGPRKYARRKGDVKDAEGERVERDEY